MTNLVPGNILVLSVERVYGPKANNPRQSYSDEGFQRLVASLEKQGQLRPAQARIRCQYDPPESEGFDVVLEDGHSRMEARLAGEYTHDAKGVRREDLRVQITPSIEMRAQSLFEERGIECSDEELPGVMENLVSEIKNSIAKESFTVNTAREEWCVYSEAVSLQGQLTILSDLYPEKDKPELMAQVAEQNGLTVSTVDLRLSLLDPAKTPVDVQEALRDREISQSQAHILRRITDEEVRKELTDKTYTEGLTKSALEKEIAKAEKKAAAKAEAGGTEATPLVKGKRKKRKKEPSSSLRSEESLVAGLSELRELLALTDDEAEPDDYQQLIGAIAALEWMATPQSEEKIAEAINSTAEQIYADTREEDQGDPEPSESDSDSE